MTSLIRHQEAQDIRSIRSVDWPTSSQPTQEEEGVLSPAIFERQNEIASLQREIETLERKLADTEPRQREAVEAARAQGFREGGLAHVRDDTKALELLADGIRKAIAQIDAQLDSTQGLVAILCETALETVFSDTQADCERTTRAIHRQVSGLRSETVLSIRVSDQDFVDEAALRNLAKAIGRERDLVVHDGELSRGECRIDLRLGHIELSLPRHWAELQALLRRLSSEAVTP